MINIIPVNDLEEHEEKSTCKCRPAVEVLEDGEIMIVHNSYDRREYQEEIIKKCINNKN